jgi:short-subunit dehydrogenase
MQKAIIVGATSGIGMEVAKLLLAEGWTLGLAGRREALLAPLQEQYPDRVITESIDITLPEASDKWLSLAERLGEVDLYLHSSGVGWYNPELDAEKEIFTAKTNSEGFVRMMSTAYNYFKKRKRPAHIAAISSIAGTKGLGPAAAYSATKKFQHTYLQALVQNSRSDKMQLTITDIRPGFVSTAFIAGAKFPMQMKAENVARDIVKGIKKRKRIVTIDWRYRLLVALWKLIPRSIWERITLSVEKNEA